MIRSILCVCKGNSCRSPILEALIKKMMRDLLQYDEKKKIIVESAGTYEGVIKAHLNTPASEHAIACMAERGLDISDHRSRPISSIDINNFDLIICMSSDELEFVAKLHPRGAIILANAMNGGVANPWQKGLAAYQKCAVTLNFVAQDILELFF